MVGEVAGRRRFQPPWDIEEANTSCFIVKDNNGQALAYVYFEQDPDRRTAANLLTHDEARCIAANIAKLPTLLVRPEHQRGLLSCDEIELKVVFSLVPCR